MGKTPTSKTALLKQLNIVVKAMLGEEFKAKSHDVNFMLKTYTNGGRGLDALKVKCSNHKTMRQIITRVCHNVVTGKGYGLSSKEIKEGNGAVINTATHLLSAEEYKEFQEFLKEKADQPIEEVKK